MKQKQLGILFSAVLVVIVSFIGGYLHHLNGLLYPVLGMLTFGIAYISIYGFRASLISFSGLMALVLSFGHISSGLENYQYALLIGLGGLWYLILSTITQHLNPKAQIEETLNNTFKLTADFLDLRRQLIGDQSSRDEVQSQLMVVQSELTEDHQTLREILILSRKSSGKSHYQDKRLLVFIQLVEILQKAMANPVNYEKMDALFEELPRFKTDFQNLILELSNQLSFIGQNINKPKLFPSNKMLVKAIDELEEAILRLKEEHDFEDYESYLMLQNFLDYQIQQYENLKRIKRLLGNPELSSKDLVKNDKIKPFIVFKDYDLRLLVRNFSLRSTIFKHSLRLAITVVFGYGLGLLFDFQNPYWIMLSIIVIMRPSYGLTKTRTKDRILGTLLGAAIATGLVYVISDPYIFGVLGLISLVIAFSMIKKNYRAGATFITLTVIFIYAISQPDISKIIQFRVIDTLVGAGLAYIAMRWLLPAWSFMKIGDNIKDSLKANTNFFKSISSYYQYKGKVPSDLKMNRKEAFLQMSNLSSAFQLMAQEPKSKQRHIDDIYELVVLNHSLLASLSSLNIYIQNNKTTRASRDFKLISDKVIENLDRVYEQLQKIDFETPKSTALNTAEKSKSFKFSAAQLTKETVLETSNEHTHKEAHLVWEQLRWLFSLSEKMLTITAKYTEI